jgi:hypothetical protein
MWATGPDGCPLSGSGPPPAGRCPECAIFAGDSVQFQAGANTIPAPRIAEATDLSLVTAKTMKRGRMRAHPRHWETLRKLIDAFTAEAKSPPPSWSFLDDGYWEREIAPGLPELTADTIQGATGLSRSYSRRVLAGWHVPHKKHWPSVRALVQHK